MIGRLNDTICAIATPIGDGGIGIVRVSGEKAIDVCSSLIRLRSGRPFKEIPTHTIHHADVFFPAADHKNGDKALDPIDEVLVVLMRAPRSYTAEDVVEIHCHGGALVLQSVCEQLLIRGARLAEPGEFTRRAFLNGRLNLTQAEAVLDTIRARTAGSLRVAQEQLRGRLSHEIDRLRETLIRPLAHVEAAIDFVEEDITFIPTDNLLTVLQEAHRHITRLADSTREGRILREGVKAAIVGRPNVGKSSLLNALLQEDRAIVTPIPGTTRDVLEEALNIGGVLVRLSDTAGIRPTDDLVEQEGIKRSRAALEEAELILAMIDGSASFSEADHELLKTCPVPGRIVVVNKVDLPNRIEKRGLEAFQPVVWVSAKTGEGLDTLRRSISSAIHHNHLESSEGALVTRLRHQTSLLKAADYLSKAMDSVKESFTGELVAMDLRGAIDALGEITGAVTTEDILDRIFSEFCIGK